MKIPLQVLCPSSPCAPGSVLLGVVQEDATVAFLAKRFEIDETFVKAANQGRSPQSRFRFASPCIEKGCHHWGDGRCRIVDSVLCETPRDDAASSGNVADLPRCSIRSQCRWFEQRGVEACGACSMVITQLLE